MNFFSFLLGILSNKAQLPRNPSQVFVERQTRKSEDSAKRKGRMSKSLIEDSRREPKDRTSKAKEDFEGEVDCTKRVINPLFIEARDSE